MIQIDTRPKLVLYWTATICFTFLAMSGLVMTLYFIGLIITYVFGPDWLLSWFRYEVRTKDIFSWGAYLTLPALVVQFAYARYKNRKGFC